MELLSNDDVAYLSSRFRELTPDLSSKYGLADPHVEIVRSPLGRWQVVVTDPLANTIHLDLGEVLVDGIELAIERIAVSIQERAKLEDDFLDGGGRRDQNRSTDGQE